MQCFYSFAWSIACHSSWWVARIALRPDDNCSIDIKHFAVTGRSPRKKRHGEHDKTACTHLFNYAAHSDYLSTHQLWSTSTDLTAAYCQADATSEYDWWLMVKPYPALLLLMNREGDRNMQEQRKEGRGEEGIWGVDQAETQQPTWTRGMGWYTHNVNIEWGGWQLCWNGHAMESNWMQWWVHCWFALLFHS